MDQEKHEGYLRRIEAAIKVSLLHVKNQDEKADAILEYAKKTHYTAVFLVVELLVAVGFGFWLRGLL